MGEPADQPEPVPHALVWGSTVLTVLLDPICSKREVRTVVKGIRRNTSSGARVPPFAVAYA